MAVAGAAVKLLSAPILCLALLRVSLHVNFSLFPRDLDLRYRSKGIEFCMFILYLVIAQNRKF